MHSSRVLQVVPIIFDVSGVTSRKNDRMQRSSAVCQDSQGSNAAQRESGKRGTRAIMAQEGDKVKLFLRISYSASLQHVVRVMWNTVAVSRETCQETRGHD